MFTILGAYASEALIFGGKLMGFISACVWILSFIWEKHSRFSGKFLCCKLIEIKTINPPVGEWKQQTLHQIRVREMYISRKNL